MAQDALARGGRLFDDLLFSGEVFLRAASSLMISSSVLLKHHHLSSLAVLYPPVPALTLPHPSQRLIKPGSPSLPLAPLRSPRSPLAPLRSSRGPALTHFLERERRVFPAGRPRARWFGATYGFFFTRSLRGPTGRALSRKR